MSDAQAEAAAPSVASSPSTPSAVEHVVANTDDLKPGQHKIVQINNIELGIYNIDGRFYAVHSMCPHQFGPACKGPVTSKSVCDESTDWQFQLTRAGEILVCPWHGMQFDIIDGQSLSNKKLRLRTFPVQVVDGEVRVQIGGRRRVV
jgi:nitrite reductase/ring-hydroxylating ferredoxin subunit